MKHNSDVFKRIRKLVDLMSQTDLRLNEVVEYLQNQSAILSSLVETTKNAQGRILKLETKEREARELYQTILSQIVKSTKVAEDLTRVVGQLGLITEDRVVPYRIREIALRRPENLFDYLGRKYPFDAKWMGEFPEIGHHVESAREIVRTQYEIRDIARKIVLDLKSSPFHTILAKLFPELDLMVITATQTNKLDLRVFSQIPCVRCNPDEKEVRYYGDKNAYPSSETLAIWTLLKELSNHKEKITTLLHTHTPHLSVDYAWKHRGLKGDGYEIPLIRWKHFGTPELGIDIYKEIVSVPTQAVILDDHGPFVVAKTFKSGYQFLKKIENIIAEKGFTE